MRGVDGQLVRASDSERESTVQVLRDHCVQGRLTFEEFDERVSRAYAATARSELERLVSDLPGSAPTAAARTAKLWWPGVAAFHVERALRARVDGVFEDALRVVVPRMAMAGFMLHRERPPRMLEFVSHEGMHVGVVLHRIPGGGTVLAAFGEAPRSVRKAFATLRD